MTLQWELGDAIFWVAFGNEKPFPLTIYRKNGVWRHSVYAGRSLTVAENQQLADLATTRIQECEQMWEAHMQNCLNWQR